jgi:triosephosphate isomerase (TIM)
MKENFLIAGNWKMNPRSLVLALKIYKDISKKIIKNTFVETALCVPTIYLPEVSKNKKQNLCIGAQDGHFVQTGSYTGLVSIEMLSSYKPKYIIIGHSEIRARGDDDASVNQKTLEALRKNIKPIICVGENDRDQNGFYLRRIREQVENALMGIPKKSVKNISIAYEPIWAIGVDAKRQATPAECLEVSIYIKRIITDLYGVEYAKQIKVLYGGSVNETNAISFIEQGNVEGLLIGRESLVVKDFTNIVAKTIEYAKAKNKLQEKLKEKTQTKNK